MAKILRIDVAMPDDADDGIVVERAGKAIENIIDEVYPGMEYRVCLTWTGLTVLEVVESEEWASGEFNNGPEG